MRILHLKLKNLNSLVGEWSIDFTNPEYESNGIFAITGPTGAGKSTLLDAICLALYGRTPRLDKITKSTNEIMSTHTGECYAEVTFETAHGRYRSFWAQQCAYKRAGEDLQPSLREIVDETTNTLLEKNSGVDAKIIELTGMDFQRFTRSMLLAQGGFDAFLKAPNSDRAAILEQITGTEIYANISKGVFMREKKEANTLESLEKDLKNIALLSEEDDNNFTLECLEKNESVTLLAEKIQQFSVQINWRSEVDRIIAELKNHENKLTLYYADEKAASPELLKLDLALKALNFEGDFRDLCNIQSHQEKEISELESAIIGKEALEKSILNKTEQLGSCEKNYEELYAKLQQEIKIIAQVRDIDNDRLMELKKLKEVSSRINQEDKNGSVLTTAYNLLKQKDESYKNELNLIQDYLEANQNDSTLIANFVSIKDNLLRLKELKKTIETSHTRHSACVKELVEAKNQMVSFQKSFDASILFSQTAANTLKLFTDQYEGLLGGNDLLHWNEERKKLSSQDKSIIDLKSSLENQQKCQTLQAQLAGTLKALHLELQTCISKEMEIEKEKEFLDHKIDHLHMQDALKNRILSLDEERTKLQDNTPCTLCGSLEHPYSHGNLPDLGAIESELKLTKKTLKQLEKTSTELTKEISYLNAEIANVTKIQNDEFRKYDYENEIILDLSKQLSLDPLSFPNLEDFAQLQHEVSLKLKEIDDKILDCINVGKQKETAQKNYDIMSLKDLKNERTLNEYHLNQSKLESLSCMLKEGIEEQSQAHELLESSVLDALNPYGIYAFAEMILENIICDLEQRLTKWKQHLERKRLIDDNIQAELMRIEINRHSQEQLSSLLNSLKLQKQGLELAISQLSESRLKLFGQKDTDKEEERLKAETERLKTFLENLRLEFHKIQHQLETFKNSTQKLSQSSKERACILDDKKSGFIEQIKMIGFSGLDDFKQAGLAHHERERLKETKQRLDKRKSELIDFKMFEEARLQELNRDPKTEEALPILQIQLTEASRLIENLKERISYLRVILTENEKRQIAARSKQTEIANQRKEAEIWRALSNLVGSSDGKKLRDFAQKMTLEMMIAHANRQLVKMSDRYLLRQSKTIALELEIVDNYQAGIERSVKNLSGGEGFIVSLSLALGLAQMSGRKVKVDTLFLDEGFGSLDERALEVALDTLSELHQEGKVIGLISHVNVLKERISTQIKVQPMSGGRSRLEGPGIVEIKQVAPARQSKKKTETLMA